MYAPGVLASRLSLDFRGAPRALVLRVVPALLGGCILGLHEQLDVILALPVVLEVLEYLTDQLRVVPLIQKLLLDRAVVLLGHQLLSLLYIFEGLDPDALFIFYPLVVELLLDQTFDSVLHLIGPEVLDNKIFKYLNDRFLPAHGLELRVDLGRHFLEVRQDLLGDNGPQALLKEAA
jgi:hypothetical protein